jgi:predicted nucleic acid-binding Zn ribbon protein
LTTFTFHFHFHLLMTTYVYETIPRHPGETPERFEVLQSMKDAALTRHPDTGQPVRRVISGGFGLMGLGDPAASRPQVARGGGGGCGCGGACSCGRS